MVTTTAPTYGMLMVGVKHSDVEELCKLLNQYFYKMPSGPIKSRKLFDSDLETWVLRYQRHANLVADGMVDTATWNALLGKDKVFDCTRGVTPQSQLTISTCWKAATAMMYNVPQAVIPEGTAKFDADKYIVSEHSNLDVYANEHGFKRQRCVISSTGDIESLMRSHGALMLEVLATIAGGVMGKADTHFVVLVYLRGDGTIDNTCVTLYDPWPANSARGTTRCMKFRDVFSICKSIFYKNDLGKFLSKLTA